MSNEVEQRIRERAYEIWVRDGQERGRAEEYWLQAEREVMGAPNEGSDGGAGETSIGDKTSKASAAPGVPRAARRTAKKATASKDTKATKPKRPS